MERKQIESVISTMSVVEQARALREMHVAMAIANVVDRIVAATRGAMREAQRAMDLAHNRAGR